VGEKTVVSLKKGLMDRDFVLNISMETGDRSFVHLERDGDGYVALASFQPIFPAGSVGDARCITIMVDCSGSMGGDSIAQAREALREIFELLRPGDWFNVIRFGDSCEKLFPAPVRVEGASLNKARQLLEVLDADMGGTEIGHAIAVALDEDAPGDVRKDVLLITDGEVWHWEEVTEMAADYDFRFFTVGVGASVSEAFVQTLAKGTGGAFELVSPNEDMAQRIVRHFKRIYLPVAANVRVLWPGLPVHIITERIASIFAGDTLHTFARFNEKPAGEVELRADLENGEPFAQKLSIQTGDQWTVSGTIPGTTSRMAAAIEIRSLSDDRLIEALAVKYQLMSPQTNFLAIDVRAEKEKAELFVAK
jgi:Ca-activated chloride channel family protein